MYAIIDLETSSGTFNKERIIEIAVYKFDGKDVVDHMSALVNPGNGVVIQEFVVNLTGIDNNMVKRAPGFHELAKRIIEITHGCTLVAHNAPNDYRILRNEFKRLGYDYRRDILDTFTLCKTFFQGLQSYGLGRVCDALGIPIHNRHRADGDAHATLELFKVILEKDQSKKIIKKHLNNIEMTMRDERIARLYAPVPNKTGVFYLHNSDGDIIYMGVALNMRKKLRNILAKRSRKARNIRNKSVRITYDITGSHIIARMKFNQEIKIIKPKYNFIKTFSIRKDITFRPEEMLLISKERRTGEEAVIYIKEGKIQGYGYTNLKIQQLDSKILENILVPLEDSPENRWLIYRRLINKRWRKIIYPKRENVTTKNEEKNNEE